MAAGLFPWLRVPRFVLKTARSRIKHDDVLIVFVQLGKKKGGEENSVSQWVWRRQCESAKKWFIISTSTIPWGKELRGHKLGQCEVQDEIANSYICHRPRVKLFSFYITGLHNKMQVVVPLLQKSKLHFFFFFWWGGNVEDELRASTQKYS